MLAHGSLQNLFVEYLGLSLHAVRPDNIHLWHELVPPPPGLAAVQFEVFFNRLPARYRAFRRDFKAAAAAACAVVGKHGGLSHCVSSIGDYRVIAASFQERLPELEELRRDFQKMAGKTVNGKDEAYLSFCRARLDTPLLNPAAHGALESAVEAAAAWYGRAQGPDLDAIESLKPVLARGCARRMERYLNGHRSKLLLWASSASGWAAWDRRDFSSARPPTAAMTFAPAASSGGMERDVALVAAARLRKINFDAAVDAGFIAGRGVGEGAALLLDCPHGGSKGRAWLETRAREWARNLERRWGAAVSVGFSRPLSEPALPDALRQADWALLMGLQRGRRVQEYEEGKGDRDAALESFDAGLALQRAVLEGHGAEIEAAQEALLGSATRVFPGREDLQRPQLLQAVLQLFESLKQRGLVEGALFENQRDEALRNLREARSPRDLAAALGRAVDQLGQVARSPRSGLARLRVEGLRRTLREGEAMPDLTKSAEKAGISPSRFSRLYKQGGTAFGEERRHKRMEKAVLLLQQGQLPVWRVAQECGYRSSSHFCALFKENFGLTPAAYRRQASK